MLRAIRNRKRKSPTSVRNSQMQIVSDNDGSNCCCCWPAATITEAATRATTTTTGSCCKNEAAATTCKTDVSLELRLLLVLLLLLLLAFTCVARLAWGNSCNMQKQHLPLCATVANVTCATTSCAAATLQRAPLLLFRATSDAAHSKRSASQVPQKSGYTAQHTHSNIRRHRAIHTAWKIRQQTRNNSNSDSDSDRATATPTAKPVQVKTTTKTRAKLAQKVDKRRVAKADTALGPKHSKTKRGQPGDVTRCRRVDAVSISLSLCNSLRASSTVTWPSPVCCAPFFAQARSSSNKQATRACTHSHSPLFLLFSSFFLLPFVCLFLQLNFTISTHSITIFIRLQQQLPMANFFYFTFSLWDMHLLYN